MPSQLPTPRPPRSLALAAITASLFSLSARAQSPAPAPAAAEPPKAPAAAVSADDQARFLAGLPVSDASPLRALQQGKAFEEHARATAKDWELLEKRRLNPMRSWAGAALWPRMKPDATTFYFFSGPDYVSVGELYPESQTYLLCGLEPVVEIPALESLAPEHLEGALSNLRKSLRSTVLSSFFKTNDMAVDFKRTELKGVVPLIYFFIARTNAHIEESRLVEIDPTGQVRDRSGDPAPDAVGGVRIRFKRPGRDKAQELYYFQLNLEDKAIAQKPGFFPFWKSRAPGNSFLKAASFILHSGRFLETRRFLLNNSTTLLQDDSGVPFWTLAKKSWDIHLFGKYLQPRRPFEKAYQKDLEAAFLTGKPAPLPFTTGYRLPGESNLVLVIRKGEAAPSVPGADKQKP